MCSCLVLLSLIHASSLIMYLFEEYRGFSVSENSSATHGTNTSGCQVDDYDEYQQYQQNRRKTYEDKSQLELYLLEPTRDMAEKIDVLEFWCKSSMRYPELARMARDLLAVPISSVASESAFSMSRKLITFSRSSLKPKTVEALMCLQDWYRWKMHSREDKTSGAESSKAATPNTADEESSSEYEED